MASCAAALLAGLWAARGLAAAEVSTAAAPGRIGRVDVAIGEIFDTSKKEESSRFFRLVNRLHLRTRPIVIERELLFAAGDPFEPELLAETERNLRRFSFLRAARVFPAAGPDGTVDVRVRVDDAWTLSPTASFRRVGEANEWRLGVSELNLLGFGKSASFELKRGPEGNERRLSYGDRQFLGRRLSLDAESRDGTEVRHHELRLGRPFYSSLSRWSWTASGTDRSERQPHFVGGSRSGNIRRVETALGAQAGRAFRPSTREVRHGTLALSRMHRAYRAEHDTHGGVPARDLRHVFEVSGRWEALRFVKVRDIVQMARDEDFNVGPRALAGFAASPRFAGGGRDRWSPNVALGAGRSLGVGGFVLGKTGFGSQLSPSRLPEHEFSADLLAYRRAGGRNMLAAHARFARLVRPTDGALMLGEETGMRGFGLNPFSGDRLVLVNLEDRFEVAEELWRVLAVGAVAFLDAGCVWEPGQRMRFGDLRSAAGLGLRLGSSRSTDTVPLRIDVAYSFQDTGRDSRWSVSIARSHAFGPD